MFASYPSEALGWAISGLGCGEVLRETHPSLCMAITPQLSHTARAASRASFHQPQVEQANQGFGRLCASAMVSQPPTKVPNYSRERSSGPDHDPVAETTDCNRRPEVSGTKKRDTDFHLMLPNDIILGKAASSKGLPSSLDEMKEASLTEVSEDIKATKATEASAKASAATRASKATKASEAVIPLSEED